MQRAHASALGVHIVALALVAAVCSVAMAFAVKPRREAQEWPAVVRGVRAASTVAVRLPVCLTRRSGVSRALASMVAPVRTVRLKAPLQQTPSLHAGGHVFPLAQQFAVADTFGAARDGVSWHHGDDLFAPRGPPALAVSRLPVSARASPRLAG